MIIRIKKVSVNKILYDIIAIVLLYFFIFNPPLRYMPFGFTKLFYLVGLICFGIVINKNIYIRNYGSVTKLFALFVLYTLVIHSLTNSQAPFFLINIFIFFESFITSFVIAYFLVKKNRMNADKLVLWTAIIAGVISLFLILSPSIAYYVRNNLLIEEKENMEHLLVYRSFGIAEDLLFSYAIALGIAACLCLHKMKYNLFYFVFFIIFLIGILFNARIGLVPISVYIIYLIIVEHRFLMFIKYLILFLALLGIILNSNVVDEYEHSINWILNGYNEIVSLFTGGEKEGNIGVLSNMIIFPETFYGLIFGTGENLFHSKKGNSDIGYILQLNYGGIIYVVLILSIVFDLFFKLFKSKKYRWYSIIFLGTFLICNIKGYFFYTSTGMRMLMVLYFVYSLSNEHLMNSKYKLQFN